MARCHLLLLAFLALNAFVGLCDNDPSDGVDSYVPELKAINPEKPLPDEHVYDSHEVDPVDTDEPQWKVNIRTLVSVAFVAQVVILALFILITQPCRSLSSMNSSMFHEDFPSKPWSVRQERMSERRYLSKDDVVDRDVCDFDTGSEEDMRL